MGACCSYIGLEDSYARAQFTTTLLGLVYIALSAVLLIFGISLLTNAGDSLAELQLGTPSIVTVGTGALSLTLGLLAVFGACKESVKVIMAFIYGSFFASILFLGSGVALMRYTTYIQSAANNEISNTIHQDILMYELAVFTDCCDPNAVQPQLCDNNGFIFPCVADETTFLRFQEFVGERTCSYYESQELTSQTERGGCAGQTVDFFIPAISGFLIGQLSLIGVVNIVGSVILLILTLSVAFFWWNFQKKKEENDDGTDSDFGNASVP